MARQAQPMGAAGSSARYRSRYSEADAIAACDGQPYDFDEAKWSRVPKGSDGRADLVDILSSLCEGRSVHFTRKLWAAPHKPALAPIAARPIDSRRRFHARRTDPLLRLQAEKVLRYESGDAFDAHRDAAFSRRGLTSFVTVQIYLNDGGRDFDGGETRFVGKDRRGAPEDYEDVVPRVGRLLYFDHDLLHEGRLIAA
ncbi:hypothetical protein JL722_9340 [Aureococcus anophagefferens]|nr:hypothetical protein JL722_9340 [Aureococcus anophagefferens]